MKETHKEISRRLAKVDFNRICPGFHPFRFALYDNERVYFSDAVIPKDERFLGNTAIQYDNEWVAIWNLTNPGRDLDSLASCLVHEMFHAYQNETQCAVFPDEIYGCFYPRELANFAAKYQEDLLLADLVGNFSETVWRDFVGLRARRLRLFPEPVEYELMTEAIEGMATYAELEALKAIAPGLYREKLERSLSSLLARDKVFDVRLVCYSAGALLQTIIRGNGLAQVAWAEEAAADPAALPAAPDLAPAFQKYYGEIDERVQGALARSEKVELAGMTLLAFDPYNVRRSGQYLYHPNFIGYGPSEQDCRFLMGGCITKMKGSTRAIEEVYRLKPSLFV